MERKVGGGQWSQLGPVKYTPEPALPPFLPFSEAEIQGEIEALGAQRATSEVQAQDQGF